MQKTNFEIFEKTWLEQISKIEKEVIDTRGALLLYTAFRRDRITLKTTIPPVAFTWDLFLKLNLLESKLIRAIETARTKYALQNRSLWVRIVESIAGTAMKLPMSTSDISRG